MHTDLCYRDFSGRLPRHGARDGSAGVHRCYGGLRRELPVLWRRRGCCRPDVLRQQEKGSLLLISLRWHVRRGAAVHDARQRPSGLDHIGHGATNLPRVFPRGLRWFRRGCWPQHQSGVDEREPFGAPRHRVFHVHALRRLGQGPRPNGRGDARVASWAAEGLHRSLCLLVDQRRDHDPFGAILAHRRFAWRRFHPADEAPVSGGLRTRGGRRSERDQE
mmetsp:Transcript_43692/g.120957  ORF Transcript_43692/g.120957 Transcript_43692/m.120957 type:complete len:219 (+) Transcript_43692:968-1624(+)